VFRVTIISSLLLASGASGQDAVQLKAGASYLFCADPIGTGHGTHTGHGVFGMGWHVGAGYERMLNDPIGLRVELLTDVRNCGYELTPNDPPVRSPDNNVMYTEGRRIMRMVHVEMPLLVVLRKWSHLRIDAGFSTAWLLDAQERIMTGTAFSRGEGPRYYDGRTATLPRLEYALLLGGEVESGRRLGMGLRYKYGLTDLDRRSGGSPSIPRTWQLSVSYLLVPHQREG